MKGIWLKIDDDIFNQWKQEIGIKAMLGNFDPQSMTDAIPALIIRAIGDGKTEVSIFPKEEKKK